MNNEQQIQDELSLYLSDPNKVTFSSPVIASALAYALSICRSYGSLFPTETKNARLLFQNGQATVATDGEVVAVSSVKTADGKCLTPIQVKSITGLGKGIQSCAGSKTFSYVVSGNTITTGCGSGSDVYDISVVIKGGGSDENSIASKQTISKYRHIIVEFMLSYLLGVQIESTSSKMESEAHYNRGMKFLDTLVKPHQ